MTVGNKICARRKELGFTLDVLAEKVGVSLAFLSQIERGTKNVTIETGMKIAEALNCTIMDIIPDD